MIEAAISSGGGRLAASSTGIWVARAKLPCSDAAPIHRIYRAALERAGLPYFHPHTFRTTLARLGQRLCRTAEEFKAWSQNLGHEKAQTTFQAYGYVENHRRAEIMASFIEGESDRWPAD